jgi:CubicO group peptidase (beta-lactamase class C family)
MTTAEKSATTLAATRAAFDRALARQPVGGASFSATVNGVEVVTLTGGMARPGEKWTPDTRTTVMSVAKGFAGLAVAMLADRGQLDPEERVAAYWPEFAANGKQDIRVRDILLHTAGVIGLPRVADLLGWDGRGWSDLDAIAAALAAAEPAWAPGTRTGYHAVTYGWLVGELVRRVDGRTLGCFFREEVAGPLGIRTAIGVPVDDQSDLAIVHPEGMDRSALVLRRLHRKVRNQMRDPATLLGRASLGDGSQSIFDTPGDFMNKPFWHAAEVPSSNGVSSARDLARLFAAVALGGELDGVRLLSKETLGRFCAPQPSGPDVVMTSAFGPITRRLLTKASSAGRSLSFGVNPPSSGGRRPFGPGLHSVGAGGYGGQLVLADPDRGVSAAFVRSGLMWSQKEITALVDALYEDLAAS